MNKRSSERVQVKLSARFVYNDVVCPGVVTNLSENGIFISTRVKPPLGTVVEIDMSLDNKIMVAPFQVKRRVKTRNFTHYDERNGIGCELMSTPGSYQEYVRSLLAH
jgi:hypothetical protein